ncbi:MAG: amidohydrolase family protein [Candidatus Hodarchaeales archaeon]|jgi:predicted TIM-barrel fold metal-dependent hydrolase
MESLKTLIQMNEDFTFKFNTLDVIDSHVHPIKGLTSGESLLLEMNKAKISTAVILALDLDPNILDTNIKLREEIVDDLFAYSFFIDHYKIIGVMKKLLEVGNTPNDLVATIVNSFPSRFIGFGSLNPSKDRKYVKSKLREIIDLNLRGIKLIPTLQFFNPKKNKNLKTIFTFAKRNDLPLLIHLGQDPGPWEIPTLRHVKYSHPENWVKLVKKFSSNKIIFAHLGGYGKTDDRTWFDSVVEMTQINENIYLDTSAVTYQLEDSYIIEKIRETCGFKRILFGTDSPIVQGTSMVHSRKIIENIPIITDEEKRFILSENSKELFNI